MTGLLIWSPAAGYASALRVPWTHPAPARTLCTNSASPAGSCSKQGDWKSGSAGALPPPLSILGTGRVQHVSSLRAEPTGYLVLDLMQQLQQRSQCSAGWHSARGRAARPPLL